MKYAILFLALMLPLVSGAAIDDRVSAGVYKKCVQWTTINDVENSKGFQFILHEDDSMSLDISYYRGSAQCEGIGETLLHVEKFNVIEKIEIRKWIIQIVAQSEENGDYYQMSFSKDGVIIHVSDKFPIKYDFNRTMHLKKVL